MNKLKLNSGRPFPKMSRLINSANKGSNRAFCENWYKRYEWLTESETKNKLFCWPCVLFSNNKGRNLNPWCEIGYDNLKEHKVCVWP